MAPSLFLHIVGIIGCIFLLYIGMRFTKDKIQSMKIGGYVLIVISTLGLLFDIYSLMYNYII